MDRRWIGPIVRLLRDEDGPTSVEYAVLLALIIVVVIGGVMSVSSQTGGMYANIDGELNAHGF